MTSDNGTLHVKIVIVDPSRVVLKLVCAILEDAGHETAPYSDAVMALERLRNDLSFDVLITSLQPHGMDGLELCAKTRALAGSLRPIYVLVMSSSSERNTVIDALDNGAHDFIGKPPASQELLARLRAAARFAALQNELIRLATIDALTGVLNRRAFFQAATDAPRSRGGLDSVAIFDIDRFKTINDTFGHAAGDVVIQAVARAATDRDMSVGRLGGEEFGLMLPGASLKDAVTACETLRAAVADLAFPEIDPGLRITCSFGAGEWRRSESVDDALKRADIALYAAKSGGRNRVIAATASTMADGVMMTASAQKRA